MPALWALMPAAMMLDAPSASFALFSGAMVLVPLAVTALCLLASAGLITTGLAVRSGSTSHRVVYAAVMSVVIPPLGPLLTAATLLLVYVDRAR